MRISNVIIRNFRSLVDVKIPFEPVTSLIGPNGSGKSSVLRALHWFFNGKPGDITDDDCSFRVAGACIEVIVSFADATDEEQSRIREIVPEAQFPLKVRKIRDPKGDESLYILGAGNPLFKEIKDAPNATQKKELYEKLRENMPGLGLEKASTGGAVDTALANWIRDNPSELQELEEDVTGRFSFAELGLLD